MPRIRKRTLLASVGVLVAGMASTAIFYLRKDEPAIQMIIPGGLIAEPEPVIIPPPEPVHTAYFPVREDFVSYRDYKLYADYEFFTLSSMRARHEGRETHTLLQEPFIPYTPDIPQELSDLAEQGCPTHIGQADWEYHVLHDNVRYLENLIESKKPVPQQDGSEWPESVYPSLKSAWEEARKIKPNITQQDWDYLRLKFNVLYGGRKRLFIENLSEKKHVLEEMESQRKPKVKEF